MKAVAVVPSKKELRLVDHPMPQLSDGNQIKVQTLDVGICGTDREICTFVYGSPPEGDDYLVLGHESLGRVVEVGENVTRLNVGDLVVPSVRRPCSDPNCNPCSKDKQDYCINGQFTERGIKEVHGFMTEFYVDDEKYFTHVPEDLRELAVMAEPLTIAEKASRRLTPSNNAYLGPAPSRASQKATVYAPSFSGRGRSGFLAQ